MTAADQQIAADDRELFHAVGLLPHDHARADALVRGMLQDQRQTPLAETWRAAARNFLAAPTDSARDHAALILREVHGLHFELHGIPSR